MTYKTSFALVASLLSLLVGCGQAPDPAPQPVKPEPALDKAPDGTGLGQGGVTRPGDAGRIRITLNADGTIVLVEGRISPPEGSPPGAPVGDWQPALTEVEGDPASLGGKVATIELFGLNDDTSDLVGPDGEDRHAHGGLSHASGAPHCHIWVGSGATRRLVHC